MNFVLILIIVYCCNFILTLSIVQKPSTEYIKLLNHSVLFFEAQRAGKLPANNRIPWRHDSTLNDGSDDNIDLSGGYYDAGNYLKFTFPLCYTVFMLSWGGTDYIQGYELANQTTYLRDQIKWATDWLIKAHPKPTTLYVQIGDTKVDNRYFGSDIHIPGPRASYKITDIKFGTDAAAMASTAFSTAALFFKTLSNITKNDQDREYADTLLVHANQLHRAAVSITPYTRYQDSIETDGRVYSSSSYSDDLVLSGISLYKATKDPAVLNETLVMYREDKGLSRHREPLDWDNKWGALYVLLAEVMMTSSNQKEAEEFRIEAERYLDDIVDLKTVNKTNGGLLFWDEYSKMNSNSIAMSTSHLLLSYATKVLLLIAENSTNNDEKLKYINKAHRYEDLAKSQLDYLFGKNPINQNYVVGERSNSPKFPHSAPASGFSNINEALKNPNDTSRSHIIYGALVGGPCKNDTFQDQRLDWSQTEVALDYNAPYQNVLAYHVMFSNEDPFYIAKKADVVIESHYGGLAPWQFALAIVLPILAVLGIAIGVFIFIRSRQRKRSIEQEKAYQEYKKSRE